MARTAFTPTSDNQDTLYPDDGIANAANLS